jgi:hypothetical protein
MNAVNPPGRGRLQFLLLAALFAAPVIAAYVLFLNPEWAPSGRTNYGQIVTPPRPLPDWSLLDVRGRPADVARLTGKWTLLYVGDGVCDQACEQRLILGRQFRLALNEKRDRVQRVYLSASVPELTETSQRLSEGHPDLIWLAAPPAAASGFFQPDGAGSYYLIDPLGNWVMTYPRHSLEDRPDQDFRGMQKDIKKLLKYSAG